ncbi:MAG: hypothetical protein AAFV86_06515 [Pseudomonadota bacterium]
MTVADGSTMRLALLFATALAGCAREAQTLIAAPPGRDLPGR